MRDPVKVAVGHWVIWRRWAHRRQSMPDPVEVGAGNRILRRNVAALVLTLCVTLVVTEAILGVLGYFGFRD